MATPRFVLAPLAFDAPVPPCATPISVPLQTPDVIVPTEVKLDAKTVEPSPVFDKTTEPSIRKFLDATSSKCSEDVQESVAFNQLNV